MAADIFQAIATALGGYGQGRLAKRERIQGEQQQDWLRGMQEQQLAEQKRGTMAQERLASTQEQRLAKGQERSFGLEERKIELTEKSSERDYGLALDQREERWQRWDLDEETGRQENEIKEGLFWRGAEKHESEQAMLQTQIEAGLAANDLAAVMKPIQLMGANLAVGLKELEVAEALAKRELWPLQKEAAVAALRKAELVLADMTWAYEMRLELGRRAEEAKIKGDELANEQAQLTINWLPNVTQAQLDEKRAQIGYYGAMARGQDAKSKGGTDPKTVGTFWAQVLELGEPRRTNTGEPMPQTADRKNAIVELVRAYEAGGYTPTLSRSTLNDWGFTDQEIDTYFPEMRGPESAFRGAEAGLEKPDAGGPLSGILSTGVPMSEQFSEIMGPNFGTLIAPPGSEPRPGRRPTVVPDAGRVTIPLGGDSAEEPGWWDRANAFLKANQDLGNQQSRGGIPDLYPYYQDRRGGKTGR